MQIPMTIVKQYNLGEFKDIKVISMGLSHKTFSFSASGQEYIIQQMHTDLATDEIAYDIRIVTEHLNARGVLAPEIIINKNGDVLSADNDGRKWRIQTKIAGETFSKISKPELAYEAGKKMGETHLALASLPERLKTNLKMHDTREIFADLQATIRRADKDLLEPVKEEVKFLTEVTPRCFLPDKLPKRVVHGDPKISNFIFQGGEAVSMIDLDTCGYQTPLVDLGDAFRSWCGVEEDNPNNHFRLALYEAGLKGYMESSGELLGEREQRLIQMSVLNITSELACRFLIDYFRDRYFGWDAERYESRREHNLARCRGQIALFKDINRNFS